ncbi:hypothetical protein KI440_00685 [Candidatus Saccharibacteria bacterium TM7i]|nr:hypothetical protein KI440_00685 [Candidatus Saccharibacteria bacterium TM7i]
MTVKTKTSAVKSLSQLFALILIAILVGIGALLFFAFQKLPTYAASVNQKLEQANLISATDKSRSESTTLSPRAQKFFSTPTAYATQAETDIRAYGKLTNIPIQSVNAEANNTVSVRITGSVPYESFLQLLTSLESNVPKMTIESLEIDQKQSPTSKNVAVNSLKIKVAVR